MDNDPARLIRALRDMPAPQPRPGFVDRALANAAKARPGTFETRRTGGGRVVDSLWETWLGAAIGAAAAAALALFSLRPVVPTLPVERSVTLALHEARNIGVLIDSDRNIEDATIRIAITGGVALDGFENEHEINWQTNLERGSNLLSLPIVSQSAGHGRLVAIVEHTGKTRRVAVNFTVNEPGAS